MKRTTWLMLALVAAFFAFTGETCTEETDIEVPVTVETEFAFHSMSEENDPDDADMDTVDLRQVLLDLEAEHDLDEYTLTSATFQQAAWTIRDGGTVPAGLTFTGAVTLMRVEGGATGTIFPSQSTSADAAQAGFVTLTHSQAGVDILNQALKDYIGGRENGSIPPITLKYSWAGTRTPVEPAYDFFWDGQIKINVVGVATVDAPKSPI